MGFNCRTREAPRPLFRIAPQKHVTCLIQTPTPPITSPAINTFASKSTYRYSNNGRMIALDGFDGDTYTRS
jgi:hypothetical protein